VTGRNVTGSVTTGLLYRSADSGSTYSQVTLPANVFGLFGAGFVDDNTALVVGDSSVILRMDVTTGTLTRLGAAQGIPQTVIDTTASGTRTTFRFTRVDFVTGTQVGFVTGTVTRTRPGLPNVITGIILITRDGGQTFTRQAIQGAPNNGEDFPSVNDVQALAIDFAALGGSQGLVAARTADVQTGGQACSFTTNP
jgi:photosystem II stability/assembly factor-like uncharacterized protein